jgi:glycosyltransferase involved in cell wall biosynthesis
LDLVDEIWCGSQFVANAFAAVTDKPVTQVRLPVEVAPFEPRSRSELGLPEGFLFLFLFDFNSSMQRKNPIGAIEAFRLAFEPEDGARLVIKTINAEMHPEIADLVDGAAAAAPHIDVVDRYVSSEDRSAMLASADCYVSLHRSEGLGLTPAEAMALGKPVIATGWSGNLDFMTDHNSYLVPYSLMPVGDDGGAYPAEGEWAEPDLAEAARLMRHVFEDRSDASLKGAKAASDLRETHSLEAAAASMSSRLEQLVIERKPAQPVGKLVEESQSDSARQRFAGSPAKRMLMRLMRPYTYHQDRVNDAVADELSRVGVELNVLRAELLAARRAAQRQGTRT